MTTRNERFQKGFLLLLVVAISAIFLILIRQFLLIILLAAIFASVCHPVYIRLHRAFGGRAALASLATLLLLFVVVVGPLATMGSIVVQQALEVSDNVRPRIEEMIKQPGVLDGYLRRLPFYDRIAPYRAEILTRGGELVGTIGKGLVGSLTGTIGGTVMLVVRVVIFMYTMFFLLMDGRRMLARALTYVPLSDEEKRLMVEKFVSVAKATLKGTLLIGLIQGTMSGIAFWVAGIQGAMFWGTLMVLLSIVPGIGAALVWVPAAIILALTGAWLKGLLLAGFCALVVGRVDNLLRPQLVGRDTKLHELFIFFSTLGGLLLFGPMGFVIGPIIAALFVTVWELYGVAFRRELESPVSTAP
jgi:predicted PurR-regulated permease PerM